MSTDNKHIAISVITTILLIAALLCAMSCDKCPTEPEFPEFRIEISADFVGASRVRLLVSVSDSGDVREFGIKRNGEVISKSQIAGKDTLITDITAEPATAYQYQGVVYYDRKEINASEVITLTTLDTTSHEVDWKIQKIGWLSSYLRDVFIISEDDIWAVGFIQDLDSAGNYITYNATHWDGVEWKPQRIETLYDNRIIFEKTTSCVFAFSYDDIWMADYPKHWNGTSWQLFHLHDMGIDAYPIKRCWGASSENIYFVGNNGFCIRYNGENWTIIPTGTSLRITDIWGTAADHIFMVGSDESTGKNVFIEQRNDQIKTFEFDTRLKKGVFATAPNDVYIVGAGLFYYDGYGVSEIPWPEDIPKNFLESVSGNGSNDLFAAGHLQIIIHYNGKEWYSYHESNPDIVYYDISVKEDLIVAVGTNGPESIMLMGKRE